MSSSGKKNRKKWKPVAVNSVLTNVVVRTTTSWAEEVENELSEYTIKKINSINLPTAPRAVCDLVIDESKIPPNGPFVANLSNLPYEITEGDIIQQFKELKIANVQLSKDVRQDRMRGFGSIEFEDRSSLLVALNEGELTIKGRPVRISLPNDDEQNKDKGGRSGGSSFTRNRDTSDRFEKSDKPIEWRAGAPIPYDPEKSVSKHSVGFTRQQNHRDREMGGGPFRESKNTFTSDFDKSSSSFSRAFRDRDERDGGRFSDRGGNRMFNKRFERDDRGSSRTSMFGKKFERDDRNREYKTESISQEKEEPKTRPKLEIQPRSVPIDSNPVPVALPSSIFGGAKPVDTSKKEKEIEEKMILSSVALPARNSRAATPRSSPTPNRSRSSSVSSLSSNRKQDSELIETANEPSKLLQLDGDKCEMSSNKKLSENGKPKQECKEPPPPPPNFWHQRKEAFAAASAEQSDSKEPSVVSEKTTLSENTTDSKTTDIRSQSETESSTNNTEVVKNVQNNSQLQSTEEKFRSNKLRTPYFEENYPENDNYFGNRYNENNKYNNFTRDNRSNNRRDNKRDYVRRDNDRKDNERRDNDRRSDNRYFKRRDDYGSNRPDSNTFINKWSHNKDGSFKNRNGGPSRKYDREDGRSGFSNYRDRNEYSSTGSNRSSASSMNNLREDIEGTREKYEERKIDDERLINIDANVNSGIQETIKSPNFLDDRLKTNVDNSKPLQNGNEKEVGNDNKSTELTENITNTVSLSEENDTSFSSSKSRKKEKKRKNQEKLDKSNDKEILKPIENERKINNQKEEKKRIPENNQVNDKSSNNNAKTKDSRNKKQSKKSRDVSDISQMTKQKEEKAPNFRDLNRFQVLGNDE